MSYKINVIILICGKNIVPFFKEKFVATFNGNIKMILFHADLADLGRLVLIKIIKSRNICSNELNLREIN
ncbi:hypothetical protein ACFFLS_06970 [Flavobacterium procerum]|uniref:Uncharacterized protein n=1 Tax=Flavobacterium procerum TaxID=1455569 RepID=A0ABV6BMV1_9FLAO